MPPFSPSATMTGGCHCGAVRFEVSPGEGACALVCTCSICRMTGFVHLIVPASDFRLLSGAGHLTEYTFNTHVAKHRFCSRCGVKSFYIPRSHPDGVSVNVNCLDANAGEALPRRTFDGANWEAHIDEIR